MPEGKKRNFTLRLDENLVRKLDYIAEYNGRDRTHEIIWVLQQHVKRFEETIDKIELE